MFSIPCPSFVCAWVCVLLVCVCVYPSCWEVLKALPNKGLLCEKRDLSPSNTKKQKGRAWRRDPLSRSDFLMPCATFQPTPGVSLLGLEHTHGNRAEPLSHSTVSLCNRRLQMLWGRCLFFWARKGCVHCSIDAHSAPQLGRGCWLKPKQKATVVSADCLFRIP